MTATSRPGPPAGPPARRPPVQAEGAHQGEHDRRQQHGQQRGAQPAGGDGAQQRRQERIADGAPEPQRHRPHQPAQREVRRGAGQRDGGEQHEVDRALGAAEQECGQRGQPREVGRRRDVAAEPDRVPGGRVGAPQAAGGAGCGQQRAAHQPAVAEQPAGGDAAPARPGTTASSTEGRTNVRRSSPPPALGQVVGLVGGRAGLRRSGRMHGAVPAGTGQALPGAEEDAEALHGVPHPGAARRQQRHAPTGPAAAGCAGGPAGPAAAGPAGRRRPAAPTSRRRRAPGASRRAVPAPAAGWRR